MRTQTHDLPSMCRERSQQSRPLGTPIQAFNVESVSIRKAEIEAAESLFEALQEIVSRGG